MFFIGDVVRVVEDMTVVHEQQKDGPGWVDDLALVSILTTDHTIIIVEHHCVSYMLSFHGFQCHTNTFVSNSLQFCHFNGTDNTSCSLHTPIWLGYQN